MSKILEQTRYTCAIGAQQSVVAIKRAIPILHSGPGCGVKVTGLIGQGEGEMGGNTIPCTNASETEVVFGGTDKLRKIIDGSLKVIDADLYVVLTGCTSDIVGDDIARVAKPYQDRNIPLVYAETGGFKSSNYVSHEHVVNAIIDQYSDKFRDGGKKVKGLVNLFAAVPYQDPFWDGNLAELKRVLEGIGLKVNVLFGQESEGLAEWRALPNAEFNIVASSWVGLGIAEHLKKKYQTPYVHFPYLPVGGRETTEFLRQVAEFGNLDRGRAEKFIQSEEKKFYFFLDRTVDFTLEFRYGLPRKFYSLLDASYSLGFSKFLLNELGLIPLTQYIVDDTPENYRDGIRKEFEHLSQYRGGRVEFENDGGNAQNRIETEAENEDGRFLIIGSSWERDLAKKLGADLLIVSVPVVYRLILDSGYAGYRGGLRLAEEIYTKVLDTFY